MLRKNTLIDEEVVSIVKNSKPFVQPKITAILHNENINKAINLLQSYRVESNFNKNLSDIIFIDFVIPIGEFISDIYNFRDSLEITIELKYEKKKFKNRYKVAVMSKLPSEYNSQVANIDTDDLDKQDVFNCTLQCIDPLTLSLKNTVISGIYHNVTMTKLLKGILSQALNKINIIGKKLEYNLNIYNLDNEKVYQNIIIEPFTKIIKLPHELQHKNYGLYNGDVGIYFSRLETTTTSSTYDIYIYPLFNYERYDKELTLPRLLIVNPNVNMIEQNEYNTYYDINTYKLMVSSIEFKDYTENARYNEGNGIIKVNEDVITDKSLVNVEEDKVEFSNRETYIYDNDNQILDYSKFIHINQEENKYLYYSNINKNKSIIGIIKLPNTNSETFIPGMAIRYLFMEKDKVVSTNGILQAVNRTYDDIKKVSITVLIINFKRIQRGTVNG